MPTLAALPLPMALLLAAVAGLILGAAANWAAYALAFHRRAISPWSAADPQAPSRRASDRLPIVGWLGLRREAALHGAGFWIRPLVVELLMAAAVAALYWWEVDRQGLVARQFEALGIVGAAPYAATLATFLAHALLLALMAAVSLVDLDEKTVPSGLTDLGTLAGLAVAALWPTSLLPHVAIRHEGSPIGVAAIVQAGAAPAARQVFVEPTTPVAPQAWPASLAGAPRWEGLAIGWGCYALWCFALIPRRWRTRRGRWFGLQVLLARVAREFARPPLAYVALLGAAAIGGVWFLGGAAWAGLFTALVGMIGASAMVWAIRIVGSATMGREAMGFGDVTLMMMVGAFLGWQAGVIVFFLAPFAALVVGILQLVLRRDDEIPYTPYLCLASAAVMVRWADVWHVPPGGFQLLFELGGWVAAALVACVALLGAMLTAWQAIKRTLWGQT